MAMSVGGDNDTTMSDINTTPLVDVMLVLLIIFLIAVPVVVQSLKLKLPNVRFEPTATKPENVSLSITGAGNDCQVYLGVARINHEDLLAYAVKKLRAEVERKGANLTADDLPEAHIRADVNTPYQCVGGAIYTMQQAGFSKVGFISEPPAEENAPRL